MTRYIGTILLMCMMLSVSGQDTPITTVILVRHAEKIEGDNPDPDLTEKGTERSRQLSEFLKEVKLDAIYSTDLIRTRATVDPISSERNIRVRIYEPSALEAFGQLIATRHRGQTILISGHSNTTPALINVLTGENTYQNLSDSEYDWVFILDMTSLGNARVKKLLLPVD